MRYFVGVEVFLINLLNCDLLNTMYESDMIEVIRRLKELWNEL